MNPQTQTPTAPNPLAVMQPGETVICDIKRHPIGIIGMYFIVGMLLLLLAVIAFGVAPHYITQYDRSQVMSFGAVIFLVVGLVSLVFLFIAHIVYWGNRWHVTSDSLTQVTQTSLFHKESSQLSLANLEDVSAEQNGILTHIFNYGVLKVETAGERSKFAFLYCPNPNYYAQQIISARERFEQKIRTLEESPEQPAATTPPQVPQAQ